MGQWAPPYLSGIPGLTHEEDMIAFAFEHLSYQGFNLRRNLLLHLSRSLFPAERRGLIQVQGASRWRTVMGITRVWLWSDRNLRENVIFAMVRERLGIGSYFYGIVHQRSRRFSMRAFLLMRYLPRDRFYISPPGSTLGGPFRRRRWRGTARAILTRTVPEGIGPPRCRACGSRWCFMYPED